MDDADRVKELEARITALEIDKTKLQQLIQPTTLDEFLSNQHELIFKKLQVQENPALATAGSITSPRGRFCPERLKPWIQFPSDQQALFHDVYQAWNPHTGPIRALPALKSLHDKSTAPQRIVSSEDDLKQFQSQVVEQNVERVIVYMSTKQALNATYQDLGNGFQFYNTAHALKDGQPEVEARCKKATADANNREQSTQYDLAPRNADQFCITCKDNTSRLVFIEEFNRAVPGLRSRRSVSRR